MCLLLLQFARSATVNTIIMWNRRLHGKQSDWDAFSIPVAFWGGQKQGLGGLLSAHRQCRCQPRWWWHRRRLIHFFYPCMTWLISRQCLSEADDCRTRQFPHVLASRTWPSQNYITLILARHVQEKRATLAQTSLVVLSSRLKIASVVGKAGMQADDGQFLSSYFPWQNK